MSTKQWLRNFVQGFSPLKGRIAQILALTVVSGLTAHAGVVVGYYQGSNASTVPLKNLVTNGSAAELNYLIYAFEEPNTNGSCTIQDLTVATQTAYTAANSVNGEADTGPLKGTFNQLKELKAKYPNLKVLVSIGGSTLSGNFAGMASAAASNASAINACAQTFIDGNFTSTLKGYSGIFDGIDIDWEYPANSTQETNFTALLKAFRSELNTLGTTNGKTYTLTATMGADEGQYGTEFIDITAAAEYLNYVNVMTYDYEASGGTGFDSPLYESTINEGSSYNISTSTYWTYNTAATFTADGGGTDVGYIPQFNTAKIPVSKLLLGIPFYGLQYSNVSDSADHGLFETGTLASTPSYAQIAQQYVGQPQYTQYCDYGNASSPYVCTSNAGSGSQETWLYDGSSSFISFDNETTMAKKVAYAKSEGLGGVMVWDLSQDSPGGCLMGAIYTGMTGNKAVNQDTALYNFESGVQSWTHSTGIANVLDSDGEAFAGCKSLGVYFNKSDFAASATAYILSPSGIKPGQTITMHIWIPSGSQLVSVNPFITNTSWTWLASDYQGISELKTGQWNTFSFTVPSSAPTTFGELGVEFDSSEAWTGQVYIDSIAN